MRGRDCAAAIACPESPPLQLHAPSGRDHSVEPRPGVEQLEQAREVEPAVSLGLNEPDPADRIGAPFARKRHREGKGSLTR